MFFCFVQPVVASCSCFVVVVVASCLAAWHSTRLLRSCSCSCTASDAADLLLVVAFTFVCTAIAFEAAVVIVAAAFIPFASPPFSFSALALTLFALPPHGTASLLASGSCQVAFAVVSLLP